ncbi:glycoside hydrolase family 16 protein [Cystobasidium minutum MCA 4210]|uniref:glycoside hydrolase family 16 protein n=1 Tax=Cystobasidium minutum MCA 4210 TaxID=1397322 RepID=UPI0034CFBECF|eukprot:jgi/Rhomi1/213330/estExt_Genemark1.C_110013
MDLATLSNLDTSWSAGIPILERAFSKRRERRAIDPDTPKAAYSKKGQNGKEYWLVFSDEFNTDGRTFKEGDDPFWTAADMHYKATKNLEYLNPGQVTTQGGYLTITLDKVADPAKNHGFKYSGGMLTSWNQMCFTGGILEASVSIPGAPEISGLWPAFWTMGNLARPGYGATTDGMWGYSYDTCDSGTLAKQAHKDTGVVPKMKNGKDLSSKLGQKLSACTCPDEDHPGPSPNVGRGAPELDVFEAEVNETHKIGQISQSFQISPHDPERQWKKTAPGYSIPSDKYKGFLNEWDGDDYIQCISTLSQTDQTCYELKNKTAFQTYGIDYQPSKGKDTNGHICWTQGDTMTAHLEESALGPRPEIDIGQRLVPREPMYIIFNLVLSETFGNISEQLTFPTQMRVDWVRLYQQKDLLNTGCNPADFPTAKYIERHMAAYQNATMDSWAQHEPRGFPQNRLRGGCADDTPPK